MGIGEDALERLPLVQWVIAQRIDGPGLSGALSQVAGFWKLLKIYIFKFWPDPRNPPNRPGKAAPDPPDIVEQPQEIGFFEDGVGVRLATHKVSRAKR